ncbi:hypothetical protein CVT26_000823 [Gymnopilus dilepis]|uniref:Uncharacterized protein n=1 Tax=Gymnopilus dilepis TaxID=231916 RepID=A0A409WL50_9AGAR|nr:hypothetical protein CVT26_000823 [Gymnopilus dilepis]
MSSSVRSLQASDICTVDAAQAPPPPRFLTIWPEELVAPFLSPIPSAGSPLLYCNNSSLNLEEASNVVITLRDDDVTPPMLERNFAGASLRLYYSGDQILFFTKGSIVLFEPAMTRDYGYLVTSFCGQLEERLFFRLETHSLGREPKPVQIHNWPSPIVLGVDNGCTDMVLDSSVLSQPDTVVAEICSSSHPYSRIQELGFHLLEWAKALCFDQCMMCVTCEDRPEDGQDAVAAETPDD